MTSAMPAVAAPKIGARHVSKHYPTADGVMVALEDFSLDVMLKNGRVVAGCFGPGDLGHADAVRFAGTCRDNARSRIALNQIAGFRVCSSAAWMGAVRQNDICVREGYRPGQQRVHVDMGGG